MTLELTAIPLALVAGVAGVLSPCVWPLVPVVTSSAATTGRSGPYWLLGWSLLLLGTLVLTGFDKVREAAAVGIVPEWVFTF